MKGAMRVRLVLDGREVICDLQNPADADGLLTFAPREPVAMEAGQWCTLRLNTHDVA